MTLTKAETHLLKGFFADEKMLAGAPFVTNTDYNSVCDLVETWEDAANNSVLVGTNDDHTTFTFCPEGFPKPPKRN